MRLLILLGLLLTMPIIATTYPTLNLKQWHEISDSIVVVKIESVSLIVDNSNQACDWIGYGKVLHSFKGAKSEQIINFNIFSGMKVGMYFHLFLSETELNKNFKSSSNSMMENYEQEHKKRCQDTIHPDYTILMEGIGSSEVLSNNQDGNTENQIVKFKNYWIKIPEKLILKSYGEDWKGISEVKLSDLIKYLKVELNENKSN